MLGPYRDVLRLPGAAAFSAAGLVARLPMSMFGLAIVFAVEHSTGAYGQAGFVAGVALLGLAAAAPLQARLADAWGQTRMLVPVLIAHGVSMITFVVMVGNVHVGVLTAVGVACGATLPQFGALVRARWARRFSGTPRLHTAYAWESVLDEVVFVAGPPLVTVLATSVDPRAGLLANAVLTVCGGAVFAAQRATDPGPRSAGDSAAPTPPLPLLRLSWVIAAFLGMGGIFGAMEVVVVAFSEESGSPGMAGVILALFAAGSLIAGLITGSIQWRTETTRRFTYGQAVLALAVVPLPFIEPLALMGVAAFVAGFAISPTLISGFSLVEGSVPAPRLTEGLAWVSTALAGGVALGAAVAGPVIDSQGASPSFWVLVSYGVLATVVCVVGLGAERRRCAPVP